MCRYCVGVKARSRSSRRPAVAEVEVTGETESDELKSGGRNSAAFGYYIWLGPCLWLVGLMCIYREAPSLDRSSSHTLTHRPV